MEDEIILDEDVIEDVAPKRIRFPAFPFMGKEYDNVVLRAPTVQMMMDAQKKGDIGAVLHLVQHTSGMPGPACLLLRPEVIARAGAYFERFLAPPPPADAGPKGDGGGSPPA